MWNNFLFDQFIFKIDLNQFLPVVPDRFYSSASSILVATGIGGAYGLLGRVIYPNAGVFPLHYAIWFALAFQIKQLIFSLENDFEDFLGSENDLNDLEKNSENEFERENFFCYHYWKVIQLKDRVIRTIDGIFFRMFHIRPMDEVNANNVAESSFLEMCRYRIWPVFKMTMIDTLSFALAHSFSNSVGFTIPDRTAVSLLIVIRSIVKDIILIPALYVYARLCNEIADKIDNDDEKIMTYRAAWIKWCLPEL